MRSIISEKAKAQQIRKPNSVLSTLTEQKPIDTRSEIAKLAQLSQKSNARKDKKEILLEAIRRNTTHGKQLSKIEKKYWAEQLYKRNVGKPQIAKELSVSDKSVGRWLSSLDQEKDEKVIELIKSLYLHCYSENQIVDELARQGTEMDKSTVSRKIKVLQERHLSNMQPPEELQLYNVWKVFQMPENQKQVMDRVIENKEAPKEAASIKEIAGLWCEIVNIGNFAIFDFLNYPGYMSRINPMLSSLAQSCVTAHSN